jgi:amidohydrolase
VAEALDTRDIEPVAGTGLLARVGPIWGRAVAVRAELDALPIREQTGATSSAKGGFMHAAATTFIWLPSLPSSVPRAGLETRSLGPCSPSTSPASESYPSGAEVISRKLALGEEAEAFVAAHVHPDVPWGSASAEPGPVDASCDNLRITVEGAGGHGAYPHRARDPILALSHVVVALQSLVSRRLNATPPGALSIGWTRAGSAENVIPEVAEAGGTLRTLEPEDREPLREAAREIVETTARAHGCFARVEIIEGEPATPPEAVRTVARAQAVAFVAASTRQPGLGHSLGR